MIKRVLSLALICVIILSCTIVVAACEINTTNSEDYIPSETIETVNLEPQIEVTIELVGNPVIYIETNNRAELKELMAECEQKKIDAHSMAEAARECGNAEENPFNIIEKDE